VHLLISDKHTTCSGLDDSREAPGVWTIWSNTAEISLKLKDRLVWFWRVCLYSKRGFVPIPENSDQEWNWCCGRDTRIKRFGQTDGRTCTNTLLVTSWHLWQVLLPMSRSGYVSFRPFQNPTKSTRNMVPLNTLRTHHSLSENTVIHTSLHIQCAHCNGVHLVMLMSLHTSPTLCSPYTWRLSIPNVSKLVEPISHSVLTSWRGDVWSFVPSTGAQIHAYQHHQKHLGLDFSCQRHP